ncbi:YrhK family protein [Alteribacillus iranensis]|uniref:YrhK-like protein n=1 Tax=Alteribacillus iranensis TaxID=930128 RepID=A0A1I2EUV4_9BACI|nr:YrhK family protein [Alteribacillus iranensis]SFE96894.1 YrhK-like protein [Alteribacillus iranensis]
MPKIRDKEGILEIQIGTCRVSINKECKLIRMFNDLFIGLFFVCGSLLNFFETLSMYGNVLYFAGSMILASRAWRSIQSNIEVKYKESETTNGQHYY